MFIKSLSAGVLSLAAALVLLGCSRPAPVEEPMRAVKVVTVGVQSMQAGAEFAGEVRARVESALGFRVAGKVTQRPLVLGQRVKAGQLLAQLDPQDYQLAADAARAQLAAAASNRDLAVAEFRRFKALKEQNFISGAELERHEASLKAAQAQFDQAQAQLSSQGHQAAYTRLLADVSGVVTAIEVEPGQVVAAGTPIVRIAQDGPRDVAFSVPEDKVALIKTGSAAAVRVWSTNTVLKGVVREVAASADPVTRTFSVKVSLGAEVSPALGTTVAVTPKAFDRGAAPVIKLPTSALFQDGNASAVWVLDPQRMTVKLLRVQIAAADGNEAVVSTGLQPGMLVVSAGVHVLSPGQKVTIYKDKTVSVLAEGAQIPINPVAIQAPASTTASGGK